MNPKHIHVFPARLLQRLVWIPLLLLVSSCTLLKPAQSTGRYYILTATVPVTKGSERNKHTGGCLVRIEPVELADYLKTKEMVVRSGTNEIHFALFHQWAEPLDSGIRRVLAEDLRRSSAVQGILTAQTPAGSSPVFTVSLQVLACEGVRLQGGNVVQFVAVWQLTDRNTILQRGVFRMKPTSWNGRDYGELAQQLSQGVGDLAAVFLDALARQNTSSSK